MLDFEELEISLQKQIIDICEDDPYNLNPKTYIEIYLTVKEIFKHFQKCLKYQKH